MLIYKSYVFEVGSVYFKIDKQLRNFILTKIGPSNYFDLASFLFSLLLKQKGNTTGPTKIEMIFTKRETECVTNNYYFRNKVFEKVPCCPSNCEQHLR